MRSLLHKEFRSLLPFLALVLFFVSLNWVVLFLTEFPDQFLLSELLSDENRTGTHVIYFIMAVALAAGLLVREKDEGTLSFLDGLPVSRAQIFFGKTALALAVLWLLPLGEFLFNLSVHAMSRTSLEARLRTDLLLTAAALDAAACLVYFAVGLALSFLRRFSLLVLGLLFWAYVFLKENGVSTVGLFNIFTLGAPVFEGQSWLVPWTKLAAQLGLALVCGSVAFVAFQFSGDTAARLVSRTQRWRGSALIAGATTVVVVGVWLGLGLYWTAKGDTAEGPKVTYLTWATARAFTDRYQLLYPADRSAAVKTLIERADAVEAKVRTFLGSTRLDPIVVDLTGAQARHAGLAYWRKVRMNLPFEDTPSEWEELLPLLAHETTHVFIAHLAGARLQDQFDSTRFFHEGLATYVEYQLFRSKNKLASVRRVAAVMRARDEAKLEELLDDSKLNLKRDGDLVYPLGEVFVAALVLRYGETAPGQVLQAFARTNAPKDLDGFALWQDIFQACGYNFSDVTDGFFAELDRMAVEHRDFVESLPRLRGVVDQSRRTLTVRVEYDGAAPGQLVCRFRPRGDTEERFFEFAHDSADAVFHVQASGYPERSFWYQLGWMVEGASMIIYEPWVEVRRR